MGIPFLCKATETSWSCINNPATPSFRAPDEMIAVADDQFTESSDSELDKEEAAVIEGLASERLFFEPGKTNSILEEAEGGVAVVEMESRDPVRDLRVSMEEMVEAYGLKEWECLEALLEWYLEVNGKHNHGFVVGAFVDLVLHMELRNDIICCSSSSSCTNAQCSFTFSSPTHCLENDDDDDNDS